MAVDPLIDIYDYLIFVFWVHKSRAQYVSSLINSTALKSAIAWPNNSIICENYIIILFQNVYNDSIDTLMFLNSANRILERDWIKSPHRIAILFPISRFSFGVGRFIIPEWIMWAVWICSVISASFLWFGRMSSFALSFPAFDTSKTNKPLVRSFLTLGLRSSLCWN